MEKFGAVQAKGQGSQDGSNAFNSFMSLIEGERGDYFANHPFLTEALEGCSSASDVIGLNYLTGRHVLEHELHPNKTVVGTETYLADIVRLWGIVKRYPHVLGDFTWTGYDYIGEAGCGIFHYDDSVNFSSVYPERAAYIGDLDLVRYRHPISYLRETVYGIRKEPYLPGRSMHLFTATYELPYEPGELSAVGYRDGKEIGRCSLATAGEEVQLCAEADRERMPADGEALSFVTVKLTDKNGIENLFASKKVSVTVEGAGRLEALGSADPQVLGSYDDTEWETYDGYVLAVVRAGEEAGTIRVTVAAEGCEDVELELMAEPERAAGNEK